MGGEGTAYDYIGRFRIEDYLGRGGQGEVFRGATADGQVVAIKLLHEDLLDDEEVVRRFQREGTLARAVDHPNVVRVVATGLHERQPYVVTEFVPGLTLGEMLETFGPFDERAGLRLAADLLTGLQAIHAAGLIHRDLKPGNVIIDGERRARIVDLGLVRPIVRQGTVLTGDGRVIGTPNYMAPEQIEDGLDIDIRVDLYALGITLYRCYAGRLPYEADSSVQIMRLHVRGRPPDLATLCPALAPRTVAIVKRLMARDREARYADATTALAAIEQRLASFPQSSSASFFVTLPEAVHQTTASLVDVDAQAGWLGTLPDGEPAFPATLPDEPAAPGLTLSPGGDPIPATMAEADHAAPPTLPPAGAVALSARVCLTCTGPEGTTRRLFCYAGDRLLLGREGIDRGTVDLCARLLPSRAHAVENRKISGHHCRLRITDGTVRVEDLGGRGGTRLNGQLLRSLAGTCRSGGNRLVLADVLVLHLEVVPGPDGPLCLLQRRGNAEHHAYLLLPSAVVLGERDGRITAGSGPLELAHRTGGLWYRHADEAPDWAPLSPGVGFSLADTRFAVEELRAGDQK